VPQSGEIKQKSTVCFKPSALISVTGSDVMQFYGLPGILFLELQAVKQSGLAFLPTWYVCHI